MLGSDTYAQRDGTAKLRRLHILRRVADMQVRDYVAVGVEVHAPLPRPPNQRCAVDHVVGRVVAAVDAQSALELVDACSVPARRSSCILYV